MPESPRDLDVRNLPPAQRHPKIFETFEALDVDKAFVLISDHDPKPLLYQFQAERPGAFDWSVLEAGPERFRIEIRRRTGASLRTVTDYMEHDHRRLDEILPEVGRLVDTGAIKPARERFAEFSCGLNRHIDAEEHVLFPTFEQRTGMTTGPTVVMRAEHVDIREQIAIVAAALETRDMTGFKSGIDRLAEVLTLHNMKEEQMLYPMADQAIGSPRERDDLVRQMQAL